MDHDLASQLNNAAAILQIASSLAATASTIRYLRRIGHHRAASRTASRHALRSFRRCYRPMSHGPLHARDRPRPRGTAALIGPKIGPGLSDDCVSASASVEGAEPLIAPAFIEPALALPPRADPAQYVLQSDNATVPGKTSAPGRLSRVQRFETPA